MDFLSEDEILAGDDDDPVGELDMVLEDARPLKDQYACTGHDSVPFQSETVPDDVHPAHRDPVFCHVITGRKAALDPVPERIDLEFRKGRTT